jgi:hypothetical protein
MKHRSAGVLFLISLASASALAGMDRVAELGRQIEEGTVKVRFDADGGYLPWLLEALDIPAESQMLVFSKTSVQSIRIGPNTPRMVFFNDSAAVGTVKGGAIELVAQDPERGMMFYLLDQNPSRYREWAAKANPVSPFSQRPDCMNCHLSKTSGLPQLRIRSVVTAPNGVLPDRLGGRETDGRTPFSQLWGGWYVTGASEAPHMGNTVWNERGQPIHIEPPGSSDIAALMVFEHQTRMMNLIAQAGAEWRKTDSAGDRVNELVDSLLFIDEAPLPGRVKAAASGFREKFGGRGPRDSKGRSLRDLDLERRLMRYPCSYMIYTEAFDALPAQVKEAVYRRMWRILAGEATEAKYEDLAPGDRRAVLEILRETKKDLPDYFQRAAR